MEKINLLLAIKAILKNKFYVNLVFSLLTTKVDLENSKEVNSFFEIYAYACEDLIKRK